MSSYENLVLRRYLEKDAFAKAGLVNLQKLYLSGNDVNSVHKDAFRDLRIMIELDLSANSIDKLHLHTFTGEGEALFSIYFLSPKVY